MFSFPTLTNVHMPQKIYDVRQLNLAVVFLCLGMVVLQFCLYNFAVSVLHEQFHLVGETYNLSPYMYKFQRSAVVYLYNNDRTKRKEMKEKFSFRIFWLFFFLNLSQWLHMESGKIPVFSHVSRSK